MPSRKDGTVSPLPGPRILLVRHGATALNQRKGTPGDVVRGQSNPPLTPEGRQETEKLAARLEHARIESLYASPLNRTVLTARAIGKPYGLKPQVVRALLPWDMGNLTGVQATLAKPVLRAFAEQHPKQPIEGGESFLAWERRFIGWLKKLMHHLEAAPQTACAATHSRCIKLLEGWLAAGGTGDAVDFDVMFRDDTEPGTIYDFRPDENGQWKGQRIGLGFVSH